MINFRPVKQEDAEAMCAIYNHYVRNTTISFEEIEITASEMSKRILDISDSLPWIVVENEGMADGYAYATKWRVRSAYRFSVEIAVYLSPTSTGKGYGSRLLEKLLDELVKLGIHVVIGGIALPNEMSVKLHEKMGFTKVAHFERVGFKNQQWIDVGYWQKLLS
ncbi:MAG: N-acetyltransferase [Cytophaga sp.]|nr:N-acetyltransferase [Undibacterium sp.]